MTPVFLVLQDDFNVIVFLLCDRRFGEVVSMGEILEFKIVSCLGAVDGIRLNANIRPL